MIQGGTASVTAYYAVPYRGVVVSVKAAFGKTVAADDTVDVKRATTSVNKITTGATTAGKVYTGTPDATNKQLIFDPASDTEANKMLKIEVSALEALLTPVNLTIEYDDSAYVTQAAVEACMMIQLM
jgi:hypothetical protein